MTARTDQKDGGSPSAYNPKKEIACVTRQATSLANRDPLGRDIQHSRLFAAREGWSGRCGIVLLVLRMLFAAFFGFLFGGAGRRVHSTCCGELRYLLAR